jgi:hypothetical protein
MILAVCEVWDHMAGSGPWKRSLTLDRGIYLLFTAHWVRG